MKYEDQIKAWREAREAAKPYKETMKNMAEDITLQMMQEKGLELGGKAIITNTGDFGKFAILENVSEPVKLSADGRLCGDPKITCIVPGWTEGFGTEDIELRDLVSLDQFIEDHLGGALETQN